MRHTTALPGRVVVLTVIGLTALVVFAPAAAAETATDGWSQRLRGSEQSESRDGWSTYLTPATGTQQAVTAVDGWAVEYSRTPVRVATDGWSHRPIVQPTAGAPPVAATTGSVRVPLEAVITAVLLAVLLGGFGGALFMRHRQIPSVAR